MVNTYTVGKQPQRDGFRIRVAASESGVPCFTSLDTVTAYLKVVEDQQLWLEPLYFQEQTNEGYGYEYGPNRPENLAADIYRQFSVRRGSTGAVCDDPHRFRYGTCPAAPISIAAVKKTA